MSGVTIVATWRSAARPRRCPTHREATSLIIRESQPSAAQLGTQDAFSSTRCPITSCGRPLSQPARGGEEHLKKRNGTTTAAQSTPLTRRGSHGRWVGPSSGTLRRASRGDCRTSGSRRSPEDTGRTVSESASLSVALASCRLNDENSRANFQNVRGDSSAQRTRSINARSELSRRRSNMILPSGMRSKLRVTKPASKVVSCRS